MNLSKIDKVKALENELIRDYQMRMEQADYEKEQALDEQKIIKVFFNDLKALSDARLD